MLGNRSETMRKDFFESQHRSRIGTFFKIFLKFVRPNYIHMSGTSPGTNGTTSPVPNQPVTVEMQTLDENGKAINVQINPQPMVTAETLQTFNKTFLNDLHRLKKSYVVRPADPKKPQTVGEKILNVLKSFGHAVRSLIYGSKNAANLLHARSAELQKWADNRNIACSLEEYQAVQAQIKENFDEVKRFLSSAKGEHKPLLNDCLKFYKNLAKNLKIAEEYHRLKQTLTEAKTDIENGTPTKDFVQAHFPDNFLDTAQENLKKELDALEKQLPLPSETRPAPMIGNPSKSMFGKAKPLFERSDAYVYYDNPHSTEQVFFERTDGNVV